MALSGDSHQRVILRQAVRQLIGAARSERAAIPENTPERQFYLGVEAAAQEILQPELAASRTSGWLERESSAFRDGYLQTSAMMSGAATSAQPPLQFRLPSFRAVD